MARSLKKWFYVNDKLLLKCKKMTESWDKKVLKVWDRACCIVNSNYEETKIIKLNNIKEKIEKEKDNILDISYKYDINLNTKINSNYLRDIKKVWYNVK